MIPENEPKANYGSEKPPQNGHVSNFFTFTSERIWLKQVNQSIKRFQSNYNENLNNQSHSVRI